MSSLRIRLLDDRRCSVVHSASGVELTTDAAPEYGGGGSSFSSTDLVGAALGSCIGSSIAPLLEREGLPLADVEISIDKTLSARPRRIERLDVTVTLPPMTEAQRVKLTRAAHTCAVHRSLGERVDLVVRFRVAGAEP